jgi:hypothetical protein
MMPAIHTPENAHIEAPVLESGRPQAQGVRPGFWCSLAQGIMKYVPPTPRRQHAPSCHPFEAPMDRLVQESPSLSLLALAIL